MSGAGRCIQLCRVPCGQAPHEARDVLQSFTPKQTDGDGRAISAGAVDDELTVGRELSKVLGEVGEREVHGTVEVALVALSRGADVDDQWRVQRVEPLVKGAS